MSYNFPLMDSKSQFKDILFNQTVDGQPPSQSHQQSQQPQHHTQHQHQQQQQQQTQVSPSAGQSPHSGPIDGSILSNQQTSRFHHPFAQENSFVLPSELQGGIGTISSRRPSYAAESFTRATDENPNLPGNSGNHNASSQHAGMHSNASKNTNKPSNNLAAFAAMNNYNLNIESLNDSFGNFNLNANFNDFQARRPSQLADFQTNQFLPQFVYQQHLQQNPNQHQQHLPPQNQNQNPTPAHLSQPHAQEQPPQPLPTQAGGPHSVNAANPGSHLPQASQHTQQQNPKSALNASQLPGNTLNNPSANNPYQQQNASIPIKLENGLILQDHYIIASPDLKFLYMKAIKYFQNPQQTDQMLKDLYLLLQQPTIIKLITFIKNLNNLTFNHKTLCLVINKNGKFDLLSYPNNSNIFLQKSDLVIVDGDRGKDLVMILEPLIDLNTAILFNFLKKLEHLKSLTIMDGNAQATGGNTRGKKISGGTHSTSLNASQIINTHSNEDNEFIITLPTKQVLRFATPKEVHKLSGKFLEEKKAFITCLNKIRELNLQHDLELINVEYQSDFKKLIFYYFAGFKRIDFRGLIKELFKIYKTRIWLCAVLPFDKPGLYITQENGSTSYDGDVIITERTPSEYELSNEQILKFSINEFQNLSTPNYFHSANLQNLILHLNNEIKGKFYGFNNNNPVPSSPSTVLSFIPKGNQGKANADARPQSQTGDQTLPKQQPQHHQQIPKEVGQSSRSGSISQQSILPNFNPFGDNS